MRAIVVLVLAAIGCGRGSSSDSGKTRGTASDPVEVCERFGDVCKLDSSRLGVCSPPKSGTGFVCAPQH